MKEIVKYFNRLVAKISRDYNHLVFQTSSQLNSNKKKFVKYFNRLVTRVLFKLKNKTNYFLISFILLILIYLSYLLVPIFYDKIWVKDTLENKLKEDFKIDFVLSKDISYNIFPTPHFLIKDTKIFITNDKKKELSKIKKLRIYIEAKNFFNKENININKIFISDANFSIQGKDLKYFNKISHNKFINKNIKLNNSNIFFKDNEETIAIAKIRFASLIYEETKKLNIFNLNGEIFNIPFEFFLNKNFIDNNLKEINFKSKKLKLTINDKSEKISNNLIRGINTLSFLNKKIITKYNYDNKTISFEPEKSKIKNLKRDYKGILSFEPFELKININTESFNLFKLLDYDSLLNEILRSRLLFNENLNASIFFDIGSNINNEIFTSSKMRFKIVNGEINFNQTKLINDKIGFLEMSNSNLYFKNNDLILNSNIILNIKDAKKLFSFFQTPKKYRKPIKNIFVNFDYDLLRKELIINKIKIDEVENNNQVLDVVRDINNVEGYNLNKIKRVINKLFSVYMG